MPQNIPDHYYSSFSHSTLKWEGTDTEENFNNRLKKENHPDLIYYKNNPITYKLNNFGFRTPDDFSEGDEGNIFLGCSHTFGTGHYLENTWSYLLNESIDGKFLNLSVPGSGIATGFRLLKYWIDKFKVNNIFIYYPHKYRYEFYGDGMDSHFTYFPHLNNRDFSKRFQQLHLENIKIENYYLSNLYAIYYLASTKNIPVFTKEGYDFKNIPNPKSKVSIARDSHLGTDQQYSLYEEMLNMYNKEIKLI